MAVLLDGKLHAQQIKDEIKEQMDKLAYRDRPTLAMVIVGNNPASEIYVRHKQNDCKECLIGSVVYRLPEDTEEGRVIDLVRQLSCDSHVTGIIVQLPLPRHIDKKKIIEAIDPDKDVDGFTRKNVAALYSDNPGFVPCTPLGVVELLHRYEYVFTGKNVAILGRSDIVGKPLAQLMMYLDATVTVCHSKTQIDSMLEIIRRADIVVSAMGDPRVLQPYAHRGELFAEKTVLVDVSMNRGLLGRSIGDIPTDWNKWSEAYTPVPGGIGPMTRAMLLKNTVKAWDKQREGQKNEYAKI